MQEYKQQVLDDIKDHMVENREAVAGLNGDELFDYIRSGEADGITGNASGSYFCNTWRAEKMLADSRVLFDDGFLSYVVDCGANLAELLEKGAETVDVWARCCALDYFIDENELLALRDKALA